MTTAPPNRMEASPLIAAPRWPSEADAISTSRPRPARLAVARAVAAFFAVVALLTVVAELQRPGPDANLSWIDLRPCPPAVARSLLALAALLLLAFAVSPRRWRPLHGLTAAAVCALLGFAVWDVVSHYRLIEPGAILSSRELPFSLHIVGCLAVILLGLLTEPGSPLRPARDVCLAVLTLAVCVAGFPLAQMSCAAPIEDGRRADALIVVSPAATSQAESATSVPAREGRAHSMTPEELSREVAAFWRDSLRPLKWESEL